MLLQSSRSKNKFLLGLGTFLLAIAIVGIHAATSYALPYGSNAFGRCQYSTCGISLSSSTTITANIAPGSSTTCTVASDTVSVSTSNSSGYTLLLSDADSTNTLTGSNGGTINPSSGSSSSPATLLANTWGYRVDGTYSFGNGPTSAVANSSIPIVNFAGVPASNSPVVLSTYPTAAKPAVATTVWYGICSNTGIPAGTYTDTITYTALAN